MFLTLA